MTASRNEKSAKELVSAQSKTLNRLLRKARRTRFGRDHSFEEISDLKSYQQHVPIRNYEEFCRDYWDAEFPLFDNLTWPGRIPYFAKSSGTTTGVNKYIPCTREMVRANNRAGMQVVLSHFKNMPSSKILNGRYFMFAGSPNLERLSHGVFAGELSGIAARETPAWAGRERYYPPDNLASISDWETKLGQISSQCLDKDIRAISGLPSWLQILFQRINSQTPVGQDRLIDWFPDLQLIVHGGMGFDPYRQYFLDLAKGGDIDFREIYAASEGFFAIADRGYGEGMQLIVDNGIFFEFVPLDKYGLADAPRYWLGTVEANVDYVLIVTTCAGLWSYVVGDIVRFVDIAQFRILFAGRLSQTLSMFGEKVLMEEVESVLGNVLQRHKANLNDFCVSSRFEQDKGRHTYVLELSDAHDLGPLHQVAGDIDRALRSENSGYATRRDNDVGMLAPEVILVEPGTFAAWMVEKGRAGGQYKVPRTANPVIIKDLVAISGRLKSASK